MKPYDPQSIADFKLATQGDEDLLRAITAGAIPLSEGNKNGIILFGDPGLGKTTCARLLPKEIEAIHTTRPLQDNAYFVNVKTEKNGVSLIGTIDNMVKTYSLNASGFHYVILDEVDRLTPQAMADLKGVMDIPYVIFIMTTNYIGKVDDRVLSRSHKIEFRPRSPSVWLKHAKDILRCECGDDSLVNEQFLLKKLAPVYNDAREVRSMMQLLVAQIKALPTFQVQMAKRLAQQP